MIITADVEYNRLMLDAIAVYPKVSQSSSQPPDPTSSPKSNHPSHPGFFKKQSPDQLQTQARQAEDWFKKWEFGQSIDQEIEEALAPNFTSSSNNSLTWYEKVYAYLIQHPNLTSHLENHMEALQRVEKVLSASATIAEGMNHLPFTARERALYQEGFLHPFSHPEAFEHDVGQLLSLVGISSFGKAAFSGSRVLWAKGLRFFGGGRESLANLSAAEREFYLKARLIGEHDFYHPESVPTRFNDTFLASRYKTYQLTEDFIFYRGGSSEQSLGQFLSFDKPLSELQVRMDKAIRPLWPNGEKSVVDTGYAIKIPKGTIVHVGDVSSQSGIFLGGTKQVFVDRPWLIPGVKIINSYALKEELLWNQIAMSK